MAKSRLHQDGKEPAGFKPRREVLPIGKPDEKRIVVRAYMPSSLAKDIALYAIERDCSVSDLLNTILRKAIPSLKVVARHDRMSGGVTSETAAGGFPSHAGGTLLDDQLETETTTPAAAA